MVRTTKREIAEMIPHFEQLTIPKPRFIGAGNWHLENLSAVTVLFGKNGCGKSVLLRAIRDTQVENAHYVVPERSGELVVDSGFIQYQLNSQKRREYSMGNFASEYRRLILARIQAYYLVRGSSRALEMPVPPSEVEGLLNQLLPDFAIELKGDNNPPYQLTRVSDGSPIQKVEQLSSGEAQLLCLGLDILTVAAIWEIKGATKRLILVRQRTLTHIARIL